MGETIDEFITVATFVMRTHSLAETKGQVITGSKMGGADQIQVHAWVSKLEPNYWNEITCFPAPNRTQGPKDKDYRSTVVTGQVRVGSEVSSGVRGEKRVLPCLQLGTAAGLKCWANQTVTACVHWLVACCRYCTTQ